MKKHLAADKNNDKKIFVCPMKCEVLLDEPRKYSKCGMKLKECIIEFLNKNIENIISKHNL